MAKVEDVLEGNYFVHFKTGKVYKVVEQITNLQTAETMVLLQRGGKEFPRKFAVTLSFFCANVKDLFKDKMVERFTLVHPDHILTKKDNRRKKKNKHRPVPLI